MKLNKIIFLKPTKENHYGKIDKTITTYPGIYLLFDKDLELIYIGKAKNIRLRILQHVTDSDNGRLLIEDKGTSYENQYSTCIPKGCVKYYSCIIEKDEDKRSIIESFLLFVIKTRFNCCNKMEAIEKYLKDKHPTKTLKVKNKIID